MSPAPDGSVTWRELLSGAVERLAGAGSRTAERDARRILATAIGCTDAELALELSRPATEGSETGRGGPWWCETAGPGPAR